MRHLIGRLAIVFLFATAGLVSVAAPAAAHPTLVATLPEAGYSVSQSPQEIGLVFDEPVTVNQFTLEGQARGGITTTKVRQARDGRVVVRPLTPLPKGRYTVRWQITAQDGDVVDGVFGFGVGTAAGRLQQAEPDTPGLGAAAVLRWLLFAALALALGGLAGQALVRRSLPRPGEEPTPLTLGGCLLGVAACLGLALHQVGGGNVLAGVTAFSLRALAASPAGVLVAIELAGFAAAALAVLSAIRPWAALPLAVVVIAEGERSHLVADSGGVGGFTIAVHLAAVALWVGALVHVARAAWRWRHYPARARGLMRSYAGLAIVVYLVGIASGAVAALLVLPSPQALWTTRYGWALIAKLGLVALASALALAARRRLRHTADTPRAARVARAEARVLVAVLAASGLLTALPPPADPARGLPYPPPMAGRTIRLGTLAGQITTGLVAGDGQVELRLRLPEWDPARDAGLSVRGALIAPGGGREELLLRPCGSGCFAGPARWRIGTNTVEMTIGAQRWRGGTAHFEVPWPARTARGLFDQAVKVLAEQRSVRFVETVSSDTSRPPGFRAHLRMSGADLLDKQPYRSGLISEPVVLERTGKHTVIAFAISAEDIYVRMTLDGADRMLREDMITPNHQISRAFSHTGT